MSKFIELHQTESKPIMVNLDNVLYISEGKSTTIYFNLPQGTKDSLTIYSITVLNSYDDIKTKLTRQ